MTKIKYLQRAATALFTVFLLGFTYLALTPIAHRVSTLCWDKANHLAAYLCLGILADIAFLTGRKKKVKLCLLFLYSVFIEVAQHFIPGRHFSGFDMLANALGLILAYIALRFFHRTYLYETFKHHQ
ncbi:MAG: VanZ family protein [Desulfobacterales bacterium]|nr:VanZ family protein [Desulfobacterales bacterium]